MPYMQKVSFFADKENIKAKDFLDIVQALQHESFGHEENVCEFGDFGDKFYICLKGTLRVFVPSPRIKGSKDQVSYLIDDLAKAEQQLEDLNILIALKEEAAKEIEKDKENMKDYKSKFA